MHIFLESKNCIYFWNQNNQSYNSCCIVTPCPQLCFVWSLVNLFCVLCFIALNSSLLVFMCFTSWYFEVVSVWCPCLALLHVCVFPLITWCVSPVDAPSLLMCVSVNIQLYSVFVVVFASSSSVSVLVLHFGMFGLFLLFGFILSLSGLSPVIWTFALT